MKMIFKYLFIFFFSIAFFSCSASFDKEDFETRLNSWLNSNKTELVKSWGPPSRIESDHGGGQIFIYEIAYQGKYNTTIRRTIMMYVHHSGKIYHWRYEFN
jgi:hypothetical protein